MNAIFKHNYKHTTIIVDNVASHECIINLLRNENIEFHTFQRKEDRKPKIILKGIPLISMDEIHEELVNHNINPLNIQLLRTKTNNNANSATYSITVSNITELKKIKTIKHLFNAIVIWEQFHKNNKPTQCFNCQEYGHGSQNCFKKPNCLKCADMHSTINCDVKEETAFKCVNCEGDHKASNVNCPSYIKYLSKITKPKVTGNDKDIQRQNSINAHQLHERSHYKFPTQNKALSYAAAVGNHGPMEEKPQTSANIYK